MGKNGITLSRWRPIIHWKGESGCAYWVARPPPPTGGGPGHSAPRRGRRGRLRDGGTAHRASSRRQHQGRPRPQGAAAAAGVLREGPPPRRFLADPSADAGPTACKPDGGFFQPEGIAPRPGAPPPPRRPPPPSFGSAPTCATARSGIDTISWADLGSSLAMTGGTPFPFENLFWPGAEASTGLEFPSIRTRARRPARGRRGRCRPECACPTDR